MKFFRIIRRFFRRIWNVLRWIPIHWNEYDWSYHYLLLIEKKKIDNMISYFEKNGHSLSNDWILRYMRISSRLLGKIIEDDFFPHSEDDSIGEIEWVPYEKDMFQLNIVGGDRERFRKALDSEEASRKKHYRLLYLIMDKRIRTWWD